MAKVFGLDFGTTNSALALGDGGISTVLSIDKTSPTPTMLRSILYFSENKKAYVGHQAIAQYLEEGATGRLLQSAKSLLASRGFQSTSVGRKRFTLEVIISIILRAARERGEEIVKDAIDTVVLGRPAMFSEDPELDRLAENRLREAALLSGFKFVHFEYEPVAAALTYEETLESGREVIALIGDFGGGTSDFTIMKLGGSRSGNRNRDVLAMSGVYIGGDTFDSRLVWHRITPYFGINARYRSMTEQWLEVPKHLFRMLCRWHLIPHLRNELSGIREMRARSDDPTSLSRLENIVEDNYGFLLFQAIETAKVALSKRASSRISFSERNLVISEDLTRSDFEAMIAEDVSQIEQCVDEALCKAQVSAEEIGAVVLTGGSSQIPRISSFFEERFGRTKLVPISVFASVAHGLGLTAARLR